MPMTRVRWILASFLGFIGIVVLSAVGAILFVANAAEDTHRWMVKTLIESVLDRNAHLDGIVSLDVGLHPTLVVTDIWVENPSWSENSEMMRLRRIEAQLDLKSLFSGIVLLPHLKIDGLKVEIETDKDGRSNWETSLKASKATPDDSFDHGFVPLLEFVSLTDLTLTYRDKSKGRNTEVFLESLVQRRQAGTDSLTTKGKGRIDRNEFSISGTSGSIEAALAAARPFPIDLLINSPGLSGRLTGTARNIGRGSGFNMALVASAPSVERLFDLGGVTPYLKGKAVLTANVKGDLDALSVSDLQATLVDSTGHRMIATGSVANIFRGTGLDIRFAGRLGPETGLLRQLPPALQASDGLHLAGRIGGTFVAPLLEEFRLRIAHQSGANLSAAGSLALDLSSDRTRVAAIKVSADVSTPDGSLLEGVLGDAVRHPGPMTARVALSSSRDRLVIDRFEWRAKSFGGIRLDVKGSIGHLPSQGTGIRFDPQIDITVRMDNSAPLLTRVDASLRNLGPLVAKARLASEGGRFRLDKVRLEIGTKESFWAEALGSVGMLQPGFKTPVENISLSVRFGWPASSALARILKFDLPELGKAVGQMTVTGSSDQLRIPAARLETQRADGLSASARGRVGSLSLGPHVKATGADFDLTARSETTAAVAGFFDQEIMELGPVRARAKLTQRRGNFSLSDLKVTAGPDPQPLISIGGEIADISQLTGIELAGQFDMATWRLLELPPRANNAALGTLVGNFALSDADGSLGIEALTIAARKTALFDLSATGTLDDLSHLDKIKFDTAFSSRDFSKLSRTLGLNAKNMGSVQFKGQVSGGGKRFGLDGDLRVGKTVVSAKIAGNVAGKRPSIRGRIRSPLLRLADFGIGSEPKAVPKGGQIPSRSGPAKLIFGSEKLPFDWLNDLDLDIAFRFDEYEGPAVIIDRIDGRLLLERGVLTLDPVNFRFFKGTAQMTGLVNAQKDTPTFQVKFTANDVDLGQALRKVGNDVPLAGEVDVILDLESAGNTPRALAASLSGKMDFAIQRGKIRAGLFSLTALDTVSWLFPVALNRRYSDLTCFIGRFSAEDGLARTEALLLDTPDVEVTGQGNIDLRTEEIRIGATPRPKGNRLIRLTSPFFIEGKLANPSIRVSKPGAVVHMAGNILLSPAKKLTGFLPFIGDRGKDSNNPCLALMR